MSWLYRAMVCLPETLSSSLHERIVFFETPTLATQPAAHLTQLLATLWHIPPGDLDPCIYNVYSERELLDSHAFGPADSGNLRLLETGCGGDVAPAVGAERIHYAAARDIDLFVSPRNTARIHAALEAIELLRNRAERHRPDEKDALAAAIVTGARDEILDAVVASLKLSGTHGPILRVTIRRPYGVYPEEVLVDADKLSTPTRRALKQLGAPVAKRAYHGQEAAA